MNAIPGQNGDKAEFAKFPPEGCVVEVKGRKMPGEAEEPGPDSWAEVRFCVCQPAAEGGGCCCCCWRIRSFKTCFSLKAKGNFTDKPPSERTYSCLSIQVRRLTSGRCFAARPAGCSTGWADASPGGLEVTTRCWVRRCTDPSAGFVTCMTESVYKKHHFHWLSKYQDGIPA